MVITQTTAPILAAAALARLPAGAQTALPVAEAASGAEADTGSARRDRAAAALPPALDPDAPVGPPPAFRANVLEAERARLREGPSAPEDDPPQRGMAEAGAAYGGFPAPAPGRLDLAR